MAESIELVISASCNVCSPLFGCVLFLVLEHFFQFIEPFFCKSGCCIVVFAGKIFAFSAVVQASFFGAFPYRALWVSSCFASLAFCCYVEFAGGAGDSAWRS